jgi:hypothetical protein
MCGPLGPEATASAASVGASAYIVGNHIVLAGGSGAGLVNDRLTLAHELTHVLQERRAPVDGTDIGGGIRVSDPTLRTDLAPSGRLAPWEAYDYSAIVSPNQSPKARERHW